MTVMEYSWLRSKFVWLAKASCREAPAVSGHSGDMMIWDTPTASVRETVVETLSVSGGELDAADELAEDRQGVAACDGNDASAEMLAVGRGQRQAHLNAHLVHWPGYSEVTRGREGRMGLRRPPHRARQGHP